MPAPTPTNLGGSTAPTSDLGWVDTPAKAQHWELQAKLRQSRQDRITVAAAGTWVRVS